MRIEFMKSDPVERTWTWPACDPSSHSSYILLTSSVMFVATRSAEVSTTLAAPFVTRSSTSSAIRANGSPENCVCLVARGRQPTRLPIMRYLERISSASETVQRARGPVQGITTTSTTEQYWPCNTKRCFRIESVKSLRRYISEGGEV